MAQAAPDLKIPASISTVRVRIIDTTSLVTGIPTAMFMEPEIQGFTTLSVPSFSFLIEHPKGSKLLFDLGVRRDHGNLARRVAERIKSYGWSVTVQKGAREILEENGVAGDSIDGIVWSHWHWDHIGDPSTFGKHTALIVGPGFQKAFIPGYPANADSPIRESDYEGRELKEIAFDTGLRIGRFNALDYFGDGSFYLLDSPGHAIGHICALARVTANPTSFIFMGGDACHHGGEFRPSRYLPFPSSLSPNPLDVKDINPCPGALFDGLFRDGDRTKPFFGIARSEDGTGVAHDVDEAMLTIEKVTEADAQDEILVVMAHDETLLNVIDFFPKDVNNFREKGWREEGRWLFVKDFAKALKT